MIQTNAGGKSLIHSSLNEEMNAGHCDAQNKTPTCTTCTLTIDDLVCGRRSTWRSITIIATMREMIMMFGRDSQFNAWQCRKAQGYQSLLYHARPRSYGNHARTRYLHADIQNRALDAAPIRTNKPLPDVEEFCLQAVVIQSPRPDLGIQSQHQFVHPRLTLVTSISDALHNFFPSFFSD